jgi:hypothetical protein
LLTLVGVLIGCAPTSISQSSIEGASNAQPTAPGPSPIPTATPSGPLPGPETIYLLDANFLARPPILSRIAAVDPGTGEVITRFTARSTPAAGLSPDGRFLYVLDSYRSRVIRGTETNALAAIDTRTHDVTWEVALPGRWQTYLGFPTRQEVWASPDGRWGYVLLGPDRLLTVDAATGVIAKEVNPGFSCNRDWNFWRLGSEDLVAVCQDQLRFLNLASGEQGETLPLPLPTGQPSDPGAPPVVVGVVGGSYATEADILYLVVSQWDTKSFQWSVVVVDGLLSGSPAVELAFPAVPDGWALSAGLNVVASADGKALYVGARPIASPADQGAQEVWSYDTTTWERGETVQLAHRASQLVLSSDGEQLYTASRSARSLSIIDINTLSEVKVVEDLQDVPDWIISR